MKSNFVDKRKGVFSIVESAMAIVSKAGVYRQVGLYVRGGVLHAAVSGGFVTLRENGSTTSPSIRWDEIVPVDNQGISYEVGKFGYLEVSE